MEVNKRKGRIKMKIIEIKASNEEDYTALKNILQFEYGQSHVVEQQGNRVLYAGEKDGEQALLHSLLYPQVSYFAMSLGEWTIHLYGCTDIDYVISTVKTATDKMNLQEVACGVVEVE